MAELSAVDEGLGDAEAVGEERGRVVAVTHGCLHFINPAALQGDPYGLLVLPPLDAPDGRQMWEHSSREESDRLQGRRGMDSLHRESLYGSSMVYEMAAWRSW